MTYLTTFETFLVYSRGNIDYNFFTLFCLSGKQHINILCTINCYHNRNKDELNKNIIQVFTPIWSYEWFCIKEWLTQSLMLLWMLLFFWIISFAISSKSQAKPSNVEGKEEKKIRVLLHLHWNDKNINLKCVNLRK